MPASLYLPLAYGSVDKPAEFPALKLPCRALLSGLHRASLNDPAGLLLLLSGILLGEEKQHLSLDIYWNVPPALLKALYGLEGGSEQIRHLLLGLPQAASYSTKFMSIHYDLLLTLLLILQGNGCKGIRSLSSKGGILSHHKPQVSWESALDTRRKGIIVFNTTLW